MSTTAYEPIEFSPSEVACYYSKRLPGIEQRGKQWRGPCPLHNGRRDDSFSIKAKDGSWQCFGDCNRGGGIISFEMASNGVEFLAARQAVFELVGRPLPVDDDGGQRPASQTRRRSLAPEVAAYIYFDEAGNKLFKVTRHQRPGESEKTFLQHRPIGPGGWKAGITDKNTKALLVRLVPFRLPELVSAPVETPVFISEGEKSCLAIAALGLTATTASGGALKWPRPAPGRDRGYRPEAAEGFNEPFRDRDVIILPDADAKGAEHAQQVAITLGLIAKRVRILELPGLPPKGDVVEWLAAGGTKEALLELAAAAPDWVPPDAEPVIEEGAADTGLPRGFELRDDGVYRSEFTKEGQWTKPRWFCSPLEIAARTRDIQGEEWGRLLRWPDSEGHQHEWAMSMSLLAGDGNDVRGVLYDGGLEIAPSRWARESLLAYIMATKPANLARCTSKMGWHGDRFVFPDGPIGPENDEFLVYQPSSPFDHAFLTAGTLKEWQEAIGRLCPGNSRLVFAVSLAFAAALRERVNEESGGFHFRGNSSTGKSTCLRVAGSVWGGGQTSGHDGYIRSWRMTSNGLEVVAEGHNDSLLCLDELLQIDPREAGEVAYMLCNGQGKSRMGRLGGIRRSPTWALLFLSSGEISLADHVATDGRRVRGGQEVRFPDIPADAGAQMGCWEDIHGEKSGDAFSRRLTVAATRYFGTPIRTFLERITSLSAAEQQALPGGLRACRKAFDARCLPPDASGEVVRVAGRFSLVAAAGELAIGLGILPWSAGEAERGVEACFRAWLECRGSTGSADIEAGIAQVRAFLGVHGASRFAPVDNPTAHVINRAGWVRVRAGYEDQPDEFLVLADVFRREVCAGFDAVAIARALSARGYLLTVAGDCHLTKQERIKGSGRPRCYVISASILES